MRFPYFPTQFRAFSKPFFNFFYKTPPSFFTFLPFLCLGFMAAYLSACVERKAETPPLINGYNYFPLKKGKYTIYEVDSITYDVSPTTAHLVFIDTASFQVKELVADTLKDAQGRPSFKIEYYTRKDSTQQWVVRRTFMATRTEHTAERVEDNQRFIKMSFPIQSTAQWNTAQYIGDNVPISVRGQTIDNAFQYWHIKYWDEKGSNYSNIDQKYTQGNKTFDSTITITHVKTDATIRHNFYKEVYARNIGLVYKRLEILWSECGSDEDTAPCSRKNGTWYQRAEKGFVLEMRLKSFN